MTAVCVDASLVLAWLLPEELSERAFALKELWDEEGVDLNAPPLLYIEVPSVLRQAIFRGRITPEEGEIALQAFLEMSIRRREPERLLTRSWDIAKSVNAPRLYDMFYLALAEIQGYDLWTADRRLANIAAPRPAPVNWVGDSSLGVTND